MSGREQADSGDFLQGMALLEGVMSAPVVLFVLASLAIHNAAIRSAISEVVPISVSETDDHR